MPALTERWADHDGGKVRYLIGGEGPHLVLCHGFLGSAENFATWFEQVSRLRTLVVPDLPGCGGSAPLRGPHTSRPLSVAVGAVLDDAGVRRFEVGGLCLGTSVAMALVRARPGAVSRIILHTPLLAPGLVRRRFHRQVRAMMAPGLFPVISWLSRRRLVSDLYKRLVVEGDGTDEAAAEVNFRNQLRAHPRAVREWLLHGLSRNDVALLRRCGLPTLVVVASDDRIVDVPALAGVLAGIPSVRMVTIDGAGHGWNEAYVRRQLEAITTFLSGDGVASSATA
ncbi:MAG: alpha/beta fold hydrolase [Candidatus Dormibacteria bacterium]